jgi:hypothetical protein
LTALSFVAAGAAGATTGSVGSHPDASANQSGVPGAGYVLLQPSPPTFPGSCKGDLATLASPVVGAAGLANGTGGWQVSTDGGVFACGEAGYLGSVPGLHLHLVRPIVGMAATPDGLGYWLIASDGGVFAFGDARYVGGATSLHLNSPIVGMVADGTDDGYWLVASDGGVFAYGNATFAGSMGGQQLNRPIVDIASPDGHGYWLVAADGGVFAFGGAPFYGSAASMQLTAPVSGVTPAPDGRGYWIVAQDGGVFAYGSARYDADVGPMYGTPAGVAPINPVIALLPGADDGSYSLIAAAPSVEQGVPGRSGYELARKEFALDLSLQGNFPETNGEGAFAIQTDVWQAAQYLLIDGSGGGSPGQVATCAGELGQLESDLAALAYGRDAPTVASVIALAGQISAFFALPSNPFQGI